MSSRIKGASIINTIAIMREVLGVNRFQAIVNSLPAETQQLIRRTLVAVEWVPLEVWSPFIQAVFEIACHRDEQQFRRVLRAVCKRDFSTVYRVHLNLASPHAVLNQSPSIWSAYFDTGSLTLESTEAQGDQEKVKLQMRDLETGFPLHALMMQAYLEQLMIMSGAQRCTVQREKENFRSGRLSCDYVVNFAR